MTAVETRYTRFSEPLLLECGEKLPEFTVAYECYGELNADRSNAMLVCHGLTADAHAAGKHKPDDDKAGWWDSMIGSGRTLDTDRYCVICSNVLGGCGGSTGPSSVAPGTGRPYGSRFPVVTIADMVDAQARLVRHLGIQRLDTVAGGCAGGFQTLEWARRYPELVARAVVIGATPSACAYTIALWYAMRRAIAIDPCWNGGDYSESSPPNEGLGLAAIMGLLIWMTGDTMQSKFGRQLAGGGRYTYSFANDFAMEAFLDHIGRSAAGKLDANSLLYLMRAMTYFDLAHGYESLAVALRPVEAETLLVSYRTDWRYPPSEVDTIRAALQANGVYVEHAVLESTQGHGAFLREPEGLDRVMRPFLSRPVAATGARAAGAP